MSYLLCGIILLYQLERVTCEVVLESVKFLETRCVVVKCKYSASFDDNDLS